CSSCSSFQLSCKADAQQRRQWLRGWAFWRSRQAGLLSAQPWRDARREHAEHTVGLLGRARRAGHGCLDPPKRPGQSREISWWLNLCGAASKTTAARTPAQQRNVKHEQHAFSKAFPAALSSDSPLPFEAKPLDIANDILGEDSEEELRAERRAEGQKTESVIEVGAVRLVAEFRHSTYLQWVTRAFYDYRQPVTCFEGDSW
ncbi:unnamed protein product, partial [Polarella glacialis]